MSSGTAVLERDADGFRTGEQEQALSCASDDVVWEIHRHGSVRGKPEFDAAIEEETTPGGPTLVLERLVEEGGTGVAVGRGSVGLARGGRLELVCCDVLVFAGELVDRPAAYQVNLGGGG